MDEVIIYTDGGCSGNPGPGGWAFVIRLGANHGATPAERDSRRSQAANHGATPAERDSRSSQAANHGATPAERDSRSSHGANHGATPAERDSRSSQAANHGATPAEVLGSGGEANTTNNRMELRAVIASLEETERRAPGAPVVVNTDSQYVKNGIGSWMAKWKHNGWRTSDKKPVKNKDLWEELDAVVIRVKPTFKWVKGHAGVEDNERCDEMVQVEIGKFR